MDSILGGQEAQEETIESTDRKRGDNWGDKTQQPMTTTNDHRLTKSLPSPPDPYSSSSKTEPGCGFLSRENEIHVWAEPLSGTDE